MSWVFTVRKSNNKKGVMVASGLLDNPAIFAGHSTTPKQCVRDWVRNYDVINFGPFGVQLDLELSESIPYDLFHQQLVFMLRSSLPKQQRNIFNALKGSAAVRDFISDFYPLYNNE